MPAEVVKVVDCTLRCLKPMSRSMLAGQRRFDSFGVMKNLIRFLLASSFLPPNSAIETFPEGPVCFSNSEPLSFVDFDHDCSLTQEVKSIAHGQVISDNVGASFTQPR